MGSKNGKPVLRDEDVEALSASSGLSPEQVREQFQAFVDEHPNGKMKKKGFSQMMSKALPKKYASKMEKHVFRVYDTNNDGVIDFVEFMVVYYIMADGTPNQVLAKIFRVFDVNSDGTISMKEMKRLIKDMYGLLKTENPEEASEKLITNSAFAEMDKNDDGKITFEEFESAVMGCEKFSRLLALKVIDIFVEDEEEN